MFPLNPEHHVSMNREHPTFNIEQPTSNKVPLCPGASSPLPNDSLAPARSALAGLRLRRIPFAASQAAQVPNERETLGSSVWMQNTMRLYPSPGSFFLIAVGFYWHAHWLFEPA